MSARRDVATNLAALFALVPGFIFPFLLSLILGSTSSDTLLLASSVALTLIGVLGNAIEMNSIAEFGRIDGSHRRPSSAEVSSYVFRVMRFAMAVIVGVGALLIALYGAGAEDKPTFYVLAVVFLFVPTIGALASTKSGEVIARGGATVAILVQSLRSVLPIILILVWPGLPLLAIALGFCAGELGRFLILTRFARTSRKGIDVSEEKLDSRGLIWQSASLATAQSGPVTDRAFLNSGPAGSITSYEMSDKLYYAGLQFLNSGFLLRRVAGWAKIRSMASADAKSLLRRDFTTLSVASVIGAIGGIGFATLLGAVLPLPPEWRTGLVWASILLVSLPMSVINTACTRLFVIGRRQPLLIRFSIGFTVGNAILDAVFFFLLGPIGIPIATVIVRGISTFFYVGVASRIVPTLYAPEPERSTV